MKQNPKIKNFDPTWPSGLSRGLACGGTRPNSWWRVTYFLPLSHDVVMPVPMFLCPRFVPRCCYASSDVNISSLCPTMLSCQFRCVKVKRCYSRFHIHVLNYCQRLRMPYDFIYPIMHRKQIELSNDVFKLLYLCQMCLLMFSQ